MPTDPEPVHGNDSSDDWGSAEERQTDPLKYDPAYLSDRYFYRVVVHGHWRVSRVSTKVPLQNRPKSR